MQLNKLDLMKARLEGVRDGLKKTGEREKANHIPTPLANNFNSILADIKTEFPEIASSLPQPIAATGHYKRLGCADDTYISLETYVEQVSRLLGVLESGR